MQIRPHPIAEPIEVRLLRKGGRGIGLRPQKSLGHQQKDRLAQALILDAARREPEHRAAVAASIARSRETSKSLANEPICHSIGHSGMNTPAARWYMAVDRPADSVPAPSTPKHRLTLPDRCVTTRWADEETARSVTAEGERQEPGVGVVGSHRVGRRFPA